MNIGIVGTGRIVETCLITIAAVDNINCIAIHSRLQSINKAKKLAETFNIEYVYECFQDMLLNIKIDFIYIGISNHVHYDYAKIALLYNKNVIIEKPFATSYMQAMELKKMAENRHLFLYEAITTMYMPNYLRMLEFKDKIGSIRLVKCDFSKVSSNYFQYTQGVVCPTFSKEHFGGALFDLNIYNIAFVVGLLRQPEETMYCYNNGYNGVDLSGTAILKYKDAVVYCTAAKDSVGDNFTLVQGSNGSFKIYGSLNYCHTLEMDIEGDCNAYVEKSPYNRRMLYEFIEFENQFINRDYKKCYRALEQSVIVAGIIDKLRPD